MGIFAKLLNKKVQPKSEESVLVYLDATNLPDEVYKKYDLSTLEDQLIEAIEKNKAGELDGNEIGEGVTKIFTYGPDADRLFRSIEPVLKAYPLCRNARVVIRKGRPGAPETEVHL
jgi:hypothetical protein